MMREKINMEVDTTSLDQDISALEKTLRQSYQNKDAIISDLDNLDYEDKHQNGRKKVVCNMSKTLKNEIIHADGIDIGIYTSDYENEYISLTDIAKRREGEYPGYVIQNWMR